jgi:hypothetical protein
MLMYLLQVYLRNLIMFMTKLRVLVLGFISLRIILLCLPIFAKRNSKCFCERSHYVRGSEFKKLAKEVSCIYCQIS